MITFCELVQKILIERYSTPSKSATRWNGTIYGLDYVFVGGEKIVISHLVPEIGQGDNTEKKLQDYVNKEDCILDDLYFEFQDEMSEEEAKLKVIETIKNKTYSI